MEEWVKELKELIKYEHEHHKEIEFRDLEMIWEDGWQGHISFLDFYKITRSKDNECRTNL